MPVYYAMLSRPYCHLRVQFQEQDRFGSLQHAHKHLQIHKRTAGIGRFLFGYRVDQIVRTHRRESTDEPQVLLPQKIIKLLLCKTSPV
jgi:hypothetical protein